METLAAEAPQENDQEQHRQWRKANPDKVREQNRRYDRKRRQQVLDHYGRKCACCGATDDLSIDHLDSELGRQHKAAGIHGGRLTHWLIVNGLPDGFQVLCRPCNRSKGSGPGCRMHARQS